MNSSSTHLWHRDKQKAIAMTRQALKLSFDTYGRYGKVDHRTQIKVNDTFLVSYEIWLHQLKRSNFGSISIGDIYMSLDVLMDLFIY